jgi:ABC-2 type transport system permease protein
MVATQSGMELRLTARRGENLLAMLGIPVAVLLVFGATSVLPALTDGSAVVVRLLPGTLALAIIATGLVNLGIATAYERSYGVLQRLGGSPLGRSGLVLAKILAVLVIEVLLAIVLVALAAGLLGWRPDSISPWLLAAGVVLGTAAFSGLGLAMAGALRAESTLLLANVLFLVALAIGGVLIPLADLPEPIAAIAALLPAAALTTTLDGALGGPFEGAALAVLAIWAVIAVGLAARTFRWTG